MNSPRIGTFSQFRITSIHARDNLDGAEITGKSGNIKLTPEVAFGCAESPSEPYHIVVMVKLDAALYKSRSKKDLSPRAEASISAEAHFSVKCEGKAEFQALFEDMDFLDRLAEQVYPLVTARLSRLLSEMGFATEFPLSLPEVDSMQMVEASSVAPSARAKRKSPKLSAA